MRLFKFLSRELQSPGAFCEGPRLLQEQLKEVESNLEGLGAKSAEELTEASVYEDV